METAGMGRRIGALFVDWIIAMLTAALLTGSSMFGANATNSFVVLGVFWLEVSVLTGLLGFSIGKRLFGLKVEGPAGRPIGWRAGVRTGLILILIPPLITNDEGRGLHDVFSESRQVRLS